MTHLQFNTGVATLLLVEVHRGSFGFHVQNEEVLIYCHPLKMMPPHRKVPLPPGKWELFGIASEISEEEAASICHHFDMTEDNGTPWRYYSDYDDAVEVHTRNFAIDSIKSICTLHNLPFDRTVVLKKGIIPKR